MCYYCFFCRFSNHEDTWKSIMKNENVLHLPSSYLFIIVECQPCICFHQTSHIFVHWFTKISISQAERTEENPRPHELGSLSIHSWQISTKTTCQSSRIIFHEWNWESLRRALDFLSIQSLHPDDERHHRDLDHGINSELLPLSPMGSTSSSDFSSSRRQ